MKNQISTQELDVDEMVIHIHLTRGMVAVLVAAMLLLAFIGYLALGHQEVSASSETLAQAQSSSLGLRKYYLTSTYSWDGSTADGTDGNGAGVCDTGFHFASLWEILDPSTLVYDTTRGAQNADSGKGPPTLPGWVRTGFSSDTFAMAGRANCNNWSTNSDENFGTTVGLHWYWTTDEDIHVWDTEVFSCDATFWVWCIED